MKIYEYTIPLKDDFNSNLPFSLDNTLFFDIETTGLSAHNSMVYLIGIMEYDNSSNSMKLTQYFASNPQAEEQLLNKFLGKLRECRNLVHFNGDTFDIPFIMNRCELLKIPVAYRRYQSIDLYKMIKPLKKLLALQSLKQKSLEEFLDYYREDKYDGGTLIKIYRDYIISKDKASEELLLLHNHDDMIGMMQILPIVNYTNILSDNCISATYEALEDSIIISMEYETSFPKELSLRNEVAYLLCSGKFAKIKIKAFTGELKYYFDNYKDYFYLPLEDYAVHKSVAQFVDKEHRQKATKENCYIKREGSFLPQPNVIFEPCYKDNHKSKASYFEISNELLNDIDTLKKYVTTIIKMLL